MVSTPPPAAGPWHRPAWADVPAAGLRERKKQETRQRLSDTATLLFLERGFDEVTVGEIAARCGVSEKTVFNHFPTKESLLLDREEIMAAALRDALSAPGSVTRAIVTMLARELEELDDQEPDGPGPAGLEMVDRFIALIQATPSLRAAQAEMMDRLLQVVAAALAERGGSDPEAPAVQITATALMGLMKLQYRLLHKHLRQEPTPQGVRKKVVADLRAAARVIDQGLRER